MPANEPVWRTIKCLLVLNCIEELTKREPRGDLKPWKLRVRASVGYGYVTYPVAEQ